MHENPSLMGWFAVVPAKGPSLAPAQFAHMCGIDTVIAHYVIGLVHISALSSDLRFFECVPGIIAELCRT